MRGAQPFVPWCHVVLPPSSRGLVCVAAVPGCAAFLLRRIPVPGFREGWGAAVVSVVGLWLGEGVVGVVWSPRVIVVSGMRAPAGW